MALAKRCTGWSLVSDPNSGVAVIEWWVNVRAIERARILRGWTKADLARVAHVDPGTVSDLGKGRRRRPTFGTVQALCVALDLTLPDVIVFEDAAA